ncbi:suppressor of RPS4-RLD 1-like isoform X2 [Chenopodium quinoa]|uniref:suppressor of RPS4-RLD 1-like isoform X2 n=1 Tax=Chenopodium quinoa TaxID=63459 RepID=UPI000B76DD91|nr:suppressor of RPS4-RLD 1-like isoform X2 [Chenopodium quinoa]
MASGNSERVELAKLCSSRNWSKAIRILDSLLARSSTIQDLCNRAFCYSQLELHKHVIKDCDRALELDPCLLQAYILKGHACSALGRKDNAVLVWKQGYGIAVNQSTDLKQLLELEELLEKENANGNNQEEHSNGSSAPLSVSEGNGICEPAKDPNKLRDDSEKSSESDHMSEVQSKLVPESHGKNGTVEKMKEAKKFESKPNGTYKKLSSELESLNKPSEEPRNKSTTSKVSIKLNCKNSEEFERSDIVKKNQKVCVARISKTKSISLDFRLSRGIAEVNEGRYTYAISIFDQILKEDPNYPEALIGRGTAYAFQRELDAAIADFTKAIETNPSAGEAWKRRGQARAALGDSAGAIDDLSKALEFEPNSADILHERGIVNFKFKDFGSAVKDLSTCVKLDKGNKSAYTYLGLSLSSIGEYKRAEESHMKALQFDREFLEAWTHLTQLYQDLANTAKAFECLTRALEIDVGYAKAYYLRGLLHHGMGDHRNSIKDISKALNIESSNVECLYLRASCHHALGQFKEAVKDYDAALDLELDSMEKFVLQCLAFYQKELALYTASKLNSEFCWFDIDGDIDPLFKEYWCKRLHPKDVCEKVYRQPTLRDSLKKSKLRKQDLAMTKQKTALIHAADFIGQKIQYNATGFLPNRRQHRMAGLAAIEIAQRVSRAWRALQTELKNTGKNTGKHGRRARKRETVNMPSQNRGGPCCSTSSSSDTSTSHGILEDRPSARVMMSWQDVYSLAVKWRQISEPCDPVVWINKLSEEFNAGFGSHTPIILGQARVVRYFPNFHRTLNAAKAAIKEKKHACSKADAVINLSDDSKLQNIMLADSCSDLHKAVGEDFWVSTWCDSMAFEGKQLEGTRITLLKSGERGYDFAIRTPCTPSRWNEFDAEMAMAWEALCNAYCGEAYGSTDFNALENVRDAILRMTYYWYNFMPLSRGSAVVGFVVLLGLCLAANMEFSGSIPEGMLVDWEAILTFDPDSFVESVKKWLYPNLKATTSWKEYPDVASTLSTTGSVIASLSTYNN